MEEISQIQIFFSYAVSDQSRVLPVYDFLVKNGYPNCWIDCKKLLPGQPWEFEIQRNLRKSEIVIIFLSHSSVNKRGFFQREIKTSLKYLEEKLNSDTYIIPIKLDNDVLVPEELTKVQWLDIENSNSLLLLKQSIDKQADSLGFDISQTENLIDEIHIIKKTIKEDWEGLPGYQVEFTIPIFNSTKFQNIQEISKIIEARFLKSLQFYRTDKIQQSPELFSWSQDMFQRTNTFDGDLTDLYHKNNYLSIVYTISWYGAGAAHPNYHYETYNYLLVPLIELHSLKDLFKMSENAFLEIQKKTREILLLLTYESDVDGASEKMLTEEWVNSGTDNWDSFSAFSICDDGIIVYFSPYQVGAYAFGAHTVKLSFNFVYKHLKTDICHALNLYLSNFDENVI